MLLRPFWRLRKSYQSLGLTFRRMRVVSVAVGLLDRPIFSVDHEFRLLVAADLSAELFGLFLGIKVFDGSFAATPLDIPSTPGIGTRWCDFLLLITASTFG